MVFGSFTDCIGKEGFSEMRPGRTGISSRDRKGWGNAAFL